MQKQQPEVFYIGVLRNFAKFTGNTFAGVSFLINFIKKETATQMFSSEFFEIFKNTLLTEHLWATVSGNGVNVETNIILKRSEL